jgi:chromosome partitioning protein
MKIITIGNQKGGVGKSTLACNLAVLAATEGQRVLIIDSDIQASSMAFRALREADDIRAVAITQPTIHKDISEFANFDLVFIDAGGRDNTCFRSAVMAAGGGALLIPVLPSVYDIWATEDTLKILQEARVYRDIKAYIVLNQVIANTSIARDAREALTDLTKQNDVALLETCLYSRVAWKTSISKGQGVIETEPQGKAAQELRTLYNELQSLI